jgi:hypothetical protein
MFQLRRSVDSLSAIDERRGFCGHSGSYRISNLRVNSTALCALQTKAVTDQLLAQITKREAERPCIVRGGEVIRTGLGFRANNMRAPQMRRKFCRRASKASGYRDSVSAQWHALAPAQHSRI